MADVPVTMTVSAKGVDATTRALADVTRSVDRMRRMQTQAVAVGNILANVAQRTARQVYAFGREAINTADGVAKSARAFGMSAQGYQELAFAAGREGVEISALNVAIRTMQTRMVTAGAVSQKLGVDFAAIRAAAPEVQFREVGKTLAAIKDPAQRTALAMEMFGRQGAMVAAMAIDFEALSAEAHRLGVIMNDGALRVAEKFNDTMSDIKAQMQAAFVNNLPNIKMWGQVTWAVLVWVYDLLVANGAAMVRMFSPDSWKPALLNLGAILVGVFVNSMENIKRVVLATKSWIMGDGFNFQGVSLMEGVDLAPVAAFDERRKDLEKAAQDYTARIAAAVIGYASATAASAAAGRADGPGAPAAASAPDRSRGLEAATFGSVEAARAISRMREGRNGVDQRQLTALENIERNTEEAAGGVEVVEYAIA